ncbi:MAG: D-aminoacyl-tRNA deacylase [Vicinamibacterales bacterium]|jgi:D-tyrosyl-tRNA(Tyr) deacylase|nr:D-aminoacyl-tRNA deacylase [Vicinamibacterales bacterium]MEE2613089.1 D-aminoacyl-tRNA deacylase [Acidobacteriota bacterium]
MRAVVQRVTSARVAVDSRVVAAIEHGLLVLVGIARDDDATDTAYLANKIVGLRVFEDADHRFNRSVRDVEGAVLLVSQFTLYGDCRRGRRPSFDQAAPPVEARAVYAALTDAVRAHGVSVQTGEFQAHMAVESVNDGPVTILLDSGKAF